MKVEDILMELKDLRKNMDEIDEKLPAEADTVFR